MHILLIRIYSCGRYAYVKKTEYKNCWYLSLVLRETTQCIERPHQEHTKLMGMRNILQSANAKANAATTVIGFQKVVGVFRLKSYYNELRVSVRRTGLEYYTRLITHVSG